ncbi:MAG: hypothetical protein AABY34_03665 [Pseudomonadota bacterium]|mgnify:FL=1
MSKKFISWSIVFIAIIIALFFVNIMARKHNMAFENKITQTNYHQKMILFYSVTCPHCKKVEDFINQYHVTQKIHFDSTEVSQDQQNLAIFENVAQKYCHITGSNLVVPLFWTGSKCIIGDQPIIHYFKTKMAK